MRAFSVLLLSSLLITILAVGCKRPQESTTSAITGVDRSMDDTQTCQPDSELSKMAGRKALLLTRFKSFDEFKEVVQIEYTEGKRPQVRLTHCSGGEKVISVLETGVSEFDFLCARDSSVWYRVRLGFMLPWAALHKEDLLRIEILGRRRSILFGEGDVAFYDIADTMVQNISEDDAMFMTCEDLDEKGYLNTFNHFVGQAFMTTLFSEQMADFIADAHERYRMPELITGQFTREQIADIDNGAVDNYLDIINNEWGQELGKYLTKKYNITKRTTWTPELLAAYLNDIQMYCSWAFQIGFTPFRPTDIIVDRFANKINRVLDDVSEVKRYYFRRVPK